MSLNCCCYGGETGRRTLCYSTKIDPDFKSKLMNVSVKVCLIRKRSPFLLFPVFDHRTVSEIRPKQPKYQLCVNVPLRLRLSEPLTHVRTHQKWCSLQSLPLSSHHFKLGKQFHNTLAFIWIFRLCWHIPTYFREASVHQFGLPGQIWVKSHLYTLYAD